MNDEYDDEIKQLAKDLQDFYSISYEKALAMMYIEEDGKGSFRSVFLGNVKSAKAFGVKVRVKK